MSFLNKTLRENRRNWWDNLFEKYESASEDERNAIDCRNVVKDYGYSFSAGIDGQRRTEPKSVKQPRKKQITKQVRSERKQKKNLKPSTNTTQSNNKKQSQFQSERRGSKRVIKSKLGDEQIVIGQICRRSKRQLPSTATTEGTSQLFDIKSEPGESIEVCNHKEVTRRKRKKTTVQKNTLIEEILNDWSDHDNSQTDSFTLCNETRYSKTEFNIKTETIEVCENIRLTRSMSNAKEEPDHEKKPNIDKLSKSLYVPQFLTMKELKEVHPNLYRQQVRGTKNVGKGSSETRKSKILKIKQEIPDLPGVERADLLFTKLLIEEELKSDLSFKLLERFKLHVLMNKETRNSSYKKRYQMWDDRVREELKKLKTKVSSEQLRDYMRLLMATWIQEVPIN